MTISLTKYDRSSNAVFRWLDGRTERCRVVRISAGQARAYVQWPESVRTVRVAYPFLGYGFITAQRPSGWVPSDRLDVDTDELRAELTAKPVPDLWTIGAPR